MNKRDAERQHRRLIKEMEAAYKLASKKEQELEDLAAAVCPFEVGDEITYQPAIPAKAFSGVVSSIGYGHKYVWYLRAKQWLDRPHKSGRQVKLESRSCSDRKAIKLVRRP